MLSISICDYDRNSPISEYIGSKIYASLEIPVHEVILGKREGKVVVGCKDFTVNKRNNSLMERRASMEQFVLDDIMNSRSFFKDENDHSIHPFRFIASMTNADCNAAVLRFAKRINMNQINAIIDNMPLQAFDLTVITTEQKDFYKKNLKTAAEQNILLVAEKLTQDLNPAI